MTSALAVVTRRPGWRATVSSGRNSAGSTPTMPYARPGVVTEYRPGTSVFGDRQQLTLGSVGRDPRWAVAWKFPPTTAVTRLEKVMWNVGKFGDMLEKTKKKLDEASNEIGRAEVRTRAMARELRNVEATIPDGHAQALLPGGLFDDEPGADG